MAQADQSVRHAVAKVFRRNARFQHGLVALCGMSNAERENQLLWRWQGNDGKVIYRDHAAAERAAEALEAIFGLPLRAYPCPRSKRGHYHLTSKLVDDGTGEKAAPVAAEPTQE